MNKFIISLSLLFLAGCSLKEKDVAILTTQNSLNTQADVALFVNGCYAPFTSYGGFKGGFMTFFLRADEMYYGGSSINAYTTKSDDATTSQTANIWASFYNVIENANFLMVNIQPLQIDSSYKARIIGECYFLRAFSYYYLVRMFGDVPLKLQPTTNGNNVRYPRVSADTVFQQIFNDLGKANNSLLPASILPPAEFGHATKGAAQAILSEAYLTYGNRIDLKGDNATAKTYYQLAENFADSVILSGQYNLIANYNNLWDVSQKVAAYKEVIFGIHFSRDPNVSQLASLGSSFAGAFMPSDMPNVAGNPTSTQKPYNFIGGKLVYDTATLTQTGAVALYLQPWFVKQYTGGDYTNDYRTERSFLTNWAYQSNEGDSIHVYAYPDSVPTETATFWTSRHNYSYLQKYIDPLGYDANNQDNDLFVIRLAEVYLIKAEAENEINGPTATAYAALNMLRARARNANGMIRNTPADLQTGLTQAQFRMKIADERALELVGEGHRWFDLIRMKSPNGTTMLEYQLSTVIPTFPSGLPSWNSTTKSYGGGLTYAPSVPLFQQRDLLFPIPYTELSTNPAITYQNPGY
jgi:hypothetical protein